MKTFECKKLRPCSGLIMAKTKTKPAEYFERHSPNILKNYNDYKKLFKESGILVRI